MSKTTMTSLVVLTAAVAACNTGTVPKGAASTNSPEPTTAPAETASTGPRTPPQLVGGNCEYTTFPGKCTVTGTGEPATFTFDGPVAGQNVKLEGNEVAPGTKASFAKVEVGVSQPCTLEFITKGTCTPCLLSTGNCGQAAWALFRAQPH